MFKKYQAFLMAIVSALVLVLTGCSNKQARCDEILQSFAYGLPNEADPDVIWYRENC